MVRSIAFATALALLAAGCQATATGTITPGTRPSTEAKASARPGTPAAASGRAVSVKVVAPSLLAKGGASILNDAGAGLIKGGQILSGDTTPARGDAESPLSDAEILAKFHELADGPLGAEGAQRIQEAVATLARQADARPLIEALLTAPRAAAPSDRKRDGIVAA